MMSLEELLTADAVYTVFGYDEVVANLELGDVGVAVLVGIHPLVHAVGDTTVVHLFGNLDAGALLRGSGNQQKVFVEIGEHFCQQTLIVLVRNSANDLAEVHESIGGIGTNLTKTCGGCHFVQLPAVAVRAVAHENFSADDAQDSLKGLLVIDMAVRLLFCAYALPEHHAKEAEFVPPRENDVLKLTLHAFLLGAMREDLLGSQKLMLFHCYLSL